MKTATGQIPQAQRTLDQSVIKVSQGATIIVMLLAFLLDSWVLVAFVAVVNLTGAISPQFSLWR